MSALPWRNHAAAAACDSTYSSASRRKRLEARGGCVGASPCELRPCTMSVRRTRVRVPKTEGHGGLVGAWWRTRTSHEPHSEKPPYIVAHSGIHFKGEGQPPLTEHRSRGGCRDAATRKAQYATNKKSSNKQDNDTEVRLHRERHHGSQLAPLTIVRSGSICHVVVQRFHPRRVQHRLGSWHGRVAVARWCWRRWRRLRWR